MSVITRIEITHHQLPLDPAFPAAWDPAPRTKFPGTIVRVHDDEGRVGIGSGDAMYGFADYAGYFVGRDPLELERHHAVLSNVAFHAGRPWPMDVALWDLAGKIRGEPVWRMVGEGGAFGVDATRARAGKPAPQEQTARETKIGGASNRIRAYASSGVQRPNAGMVEVARRAAERGFPALKLRFGRTSIDDDIAMVRAVRDAVGNRLELMVDCNQGWRMPWDTQAPWAVAKAIAVARELEGERLYWIEEPLHRGDYAGYAELKQHTATRIAGGEMTREPYEFRELLERGCLDVFQPDCVCSMGITGLRELTRDVRAAGKVFTPHTWGNGIGLMANLHLTAGTVGAPFIEFPWDPPEWTTQRRDYMLSHTIEPDDDGWITLSDAPGLGIELDEAMLERTKSEQATFS